jgi:hypothetical protein
MFPTPHPADRRLQHPSGVPLPAVTIVGRHVADSIHAHPGDPDGDGQREDLQAADRATVEPQLHVDDAIWRVLVRENGSCVRGHHVLTYRLSP